MSEKRIDQETKEQFPEFKWAVIAFAVIEALALAALVIIKLNQ